MPIELASNPLPAQFTLNQDWVDQIFSMVEWYDSAPDWFEFSDWQFEQYSNQTMEALESAPEWESLTEDQQSRCDFVIREGILFVEFEGSIPITVVVSPDVNREI